MIGLARSWLRKKRKRGECWYIVHKEFLGVRLWLLDIVRFPFFISKVLSLCFWLNIDLTFPIIVMQALNLKFDQALTHLQATRPLVKLNEGFEYQLKVWQQLHYDVYDSEGKEKEGYKRLKEYRERMLEAGEEVRNRARFKGVAGLAANFGKKRNEILGDQKEGMEGKSKAWERVERMEGEWTRKMIGGEVLPWMEESKERRREEDREARGEKDMK